LRFDLCRIVFQIKFLFVINHLQNMSKVLLDKPADSPLAHVTTRTIKTIPINFKFVPFLCDFDIIFIGFIISNKFKIEKINQNILIN
jgi:hypothetical protein